jgi:hypothetical protein
MARLVVIWMPVVIVATFMIGQREALADLKHRYSFTSNANDSLGSANGTVIDPGAITSFSGGQLDLSAIDGQNSNQDPFSVGAFVDLPNGTISGAFTSGTNRAASFETWVTVETHRPWAEIYAFGTSNCGENSSCSGSDTDYITLIPFNGAGSGTLWTVGHPAFGGDAPADAGVVLPIDVEQHILSVFDHNDTTAGPNGTIRQYLNGRPAGQTAIHPNLQLDVMMDDNNWLGRSQWPDPLFDGSFNEFRIYDHATSADQVALNNVLGPDQAADVPPEGIMSLEVDTASNAVTLRNHLNVPLPIHQYQITSAGGALSPGGWDSLDDQEGADPPGEGWDEAGVPSMNQLVELYLGESGDELGANASLSLGNAYDNSVFGSGSTGDLVFRFGLTNGAQLTGMVTYVGVQAVDGDYNGDGVVNAADYVLWRNGGPLQNDPTPGVQAADYDFWVSRFGATSGMGAGGAAAVPEPAAWLLSVAGAVALLGRPRVRI